MQTREIAIDTMNRLGKEKRPFFFMVDFSQENTLIVPCNELHRHNLHIAMPNYETPKANSPSSKQISIEIGNYDRETYNRQIAYVIEQIKKGNSFLVNLTCQTPIEINASLKEIFHESSAKYKLCYDDRFLAFSPECFVKIKNGKIFSFPMKGTIDASLPDAHEKLINDSKEKAEHYTIVDLIRNDLSMVSDDVHVNRFRYIEKVGTHRGDLLQASSEICGQLPKNYTEKIGQIIFTLLPAGSISGAPKDKTVEIIHAAEKYERGFYTGIFGIFDGRNLDSAVMIRFIEKTPNGYVYKSGGGITASSNPAQEYEEMLKKIYVPINRNH